MCILLKKCVVLCVIIILIFNTLLCEKTRVGVKKKVCVSSGL